MSELVDSIRKSAREAYDGRPVSYKWVQQVANSVAELEQRLAAAEARIEELCVEREVYREAGVNLSRTACREDIDTEASRIMEQRGETWGEHLSEQGCRDETT